LVILIVALLFLGPDKLPDAAKKISQGIRDIKKQSRALQRTIEDDEHIGGAIRDLKSALRGEEEPIRPKPIKPPKQLEPAETPSLPEGSAPLLEPGAAATPSESSGSQAGELVAVTAAPSAAVTLAALSLDSTTDPAGPDAGSTSSTEETFRGVLAPMAPASSASSPASGSGSSGSGSSASSPSGSGSSASSPSSPSPSSLRLPASAERDLGPAEPTLRGVAVPKPPAGSGGSSKLTMPPTAGEHDDEVPGSTPADDAELAALVRPAPHTIPRSSSTPPTAPAADPTDKPESKHG
jgi:Sec-independent protein translocase protein TatA